MKTLARLLRFGRPYRWLLLNGVISMAILSAIGMARPYLTKLLIDLVVVGGQYRYLLWLSLAVVAVSAARGIFNFLRQYLSQLYGQKVVYDLRNALYDRLQGLSFSYYDTAQTGQLMSRLTGDVEAVRTFLSFGFVHMMDFFFMLTFVLIILFSLDWRLTVASLAAMPFLAVVVIFFDKRVRPAFSAIQQQLAVLTATIQENITGVRVVKAFARESHEVDKFSKENREFFNKSVTASNLWATFIPLMDFVSGLSATFVLWYGGRQYIHDAISLGTLVAFTSYIWTLVWTTRDLGWLLNILEQSVASGERLFEILDTPSAIKDRPDALDLAAVDGHVRFERVSFSYGGEAPVLQDINLDAPPGTLIALLGTTGSGKTSIVDLIPRFYEVSAGRVLVDGRDVRGVTLNSLRRNIGMALQETFLFSASIRENLAYGHPDATDEQIIAAAKAAQAHDFIMELPQGYETMVGERGIGLSGGQKQRVAIARAIVTDPRILILDDSTSSVDMETEHLIHLALREVMRNRTTFVIAHRLSTVKHADEIIVLEEGRIVERGRHEELLRIGGHYKRIYSVQFKDQEEVLSQAAGAAGSGGAAGSAEGGAGK
ncbi:MAG: ABC transporter ATP-binding protein [Bacillota bacterium]